MPTTTSRVVVFARPALDRETRFMEGVNADQPTYGQVEIVRKEIFERRADGNVARLLETWENESVLAVVDTEGAHHLASTLVSAITRSLKIEKGRGR